MNIGLWLLFLASLLAGLQQQLAPRSFYDSFPGFGRSWVSIDGPYNEHLMRDLGGANLGLLPTLIDQVLQTLALSLVLLVSLFTLVRAGGIGDPSDHSTQHVNSTTVESETPEKRMIALHS